MKLLAITNNPERASFRQRFAVYIDFLRSEGIDVTVAVLPSGISPRIGLFKTAGQYDVVFLHKKCLNVIDSFVLRLRLALESGDPLTYLNSVFRNICKVRHNDCLG